MQAVASLTRLYFPVSSEPGPGGYDVLRQGEALATFFCRDVDAQRPHYLAQKREIALRPRRGPAQLSGPATSQLV